MNESKSINTDMNFADFGNKWNRILSQKERKLMNTNDPPGMYNGYTGTTLWLCLIAIENGFLQRVFPLIAWWIFP